MKDFLKLLFVVLMFVSTILAWPAYSYFEAKAYNSVTGKNVSTWDAMFLELRVTNE
jgi:hypothetical protein